VTLVAAPDLAIAKNSNGTFQRGGTGSFNILVMNVSSVPSSGPVAVTDDLPEGLTATGVSGTGWTCSTTPLLCVRANSLAPGESYPQITVDVHVAANAPATLINTATVRGGGDTNPANNTATALVNQVAPVTDLAISKELVGGELQPGQTGVRYLIIVQNASVSVHTGTVTVGDIPPNSLTVTGMAGPGWSCSVSLLRCTRTDDLAPGASYPPIVVTANVSPDASGTLTNFAGVFGGSETILTNNIARSQIIVGPPKPVAVPALSPPALLLMAIGLGLSGARLLRRALARTAGLD
jgi:uncharacterized repeat protein (TIGR01451 family)